MSFPLVGNSKISSAVTNAINEKRLPHAILIEGDFGTGRHTLAFYLARAAICDNSTGCGECRNCSLSPHAHPDVTVIAPEDGKKNISIAQIRSFRNEIFIKPHMANKRVFIIDCADTLNIQSQNALLKTLEEPPVNCMFILIAESKASLLDTIISRCITLTLSVPDNKTALDYLKSAGNFDEEMIKAALEQTHCNIGVTLNLLNGKSKSKAADMAKEFTEFMVRGDKWGMLSLTAPLEKSRVETELFIKELKLYLADKLRSNPKSSYAKIYCSFYYKICKLEKSLITNVNLALFFCSLVAGAYEITR